MFISLKKQASFVHSTSVIFNFLFPQTLEHTTEPTISLLEAVVRDEKLRDIRFAGLHSKSRSIGEKIRGVGEEGFEIRAL